MFPKREPAPVMSKTKAIHEFCKSCIYDPKDQGTWREQVERCTSTNCALHQHRPMTVATINLVRKNKAGVPNIIEVDIDALVDGLEADDETEAVA